MSQYLDSKKKIDIFFESLASQWPYPTRIILVGGAVALLVGGCRVTEDIDFEVSLPDIPEKDKFFQAISQVKQETGIGFQFDESIERWSRISFLDYRNHIKFYKRYGTITVYLLEISYYTLTKVVRYLSQDITDLMTVLQKEKPDPLELANLWHRALQESPLSEKIYQTKRQMHDFFKSNGRKIWGNSCPLEKILPMFEFK